MRGRGVSGGGAGGKQGEEMGRGGAGRGVGAGRGSWDAAASSHRLLDHRRLRRLPCVLLMLRPCLVTPQWNTYMLVNREDGMSKREGLAIRKAAN